MNDYRHNVRGAAGFVLYVALLTILMAGAAGGVFLYAAYNHSQAARRWHEADQCLLDAQSGLEKIKYELVQGYISNQAVAADALAWFQTWTTNAIGSNPSYILPPLNMINDSAVIVTIAGVTVEANAGYADIILLSAAARAAPCAVTRLVQETLRIVAGGGVDSRSFDYAYFINKNARISGARRVINGDMRAAGNFNLANNPEVNGNIYASGSIDGNTRYWLRNEYWSKAMSPARPTDPTDAAGNYPWPMGYNAADVTRSANVQAEFMPRIGDINQLADMANGVISQNGVNIVVNFYDGAGPDGVAGTADDGSLVLIGASAARPIHIKGSVVIKGDLIIRGHVAGQGVIHAGRNIHIVGGLSYLNPPAWPKAQNTGDSNPRQTAAANATKDLLVLAARGNIVVGNYTTADWSNRVWNIMTDPANISPRNVAASDAEIGYDSDNDPANGYLFDGRYHVDEAHGGRRLSGAGTNTLPRKHYESSLADATFSALCAPRVHAINAALFSNHGIIGDIGSANTIINGAMVCHDDLHNYYGAFTLNWDIRLGSYGKEKVNINFLPGTGGGGTGTITTATTTGWRETH